MEIQAPDPCPTKTISTHPVFVDQVFFALNIHENRYVIVIGENILNEFLSTAAIYDLQTDHCIALPDLPITAYETDYEVHHGAIIKGHFYAILKANYDESDEYPDYFDIYRIRLSSSTLSKWEEMSTDYTIDADGPIKLATDGIYLFIFKTDENLRDASARHIFDQLVVYDTKSNAFTEFSLPKHLTVITAVVVKNKIYVIGQDKRYRMHLEIFDISSRSWRRDHQRLMKDCNENISNKSYAFSVDRWIVFRDNKCITCIYDTFDESWIRNEVLVSSSSLFRISGSITIKNSKLALLGGMYGEEERALFTIERKYFIPNWLIMKDFILLRKLMKDGRANSKSVTKNEIDGTLKSLIVSLHSDIFMLVLSFL